MQTSFSDSEILGKFLGQPNLAQHIATKEELKAAYQHIKTLEADLEECAEYFHDRCDVLDGDGEHLPNEEMRLWSMIQETLYGPGNF